MWLAGPDTGPRGAVSRLLALALLLSHSKVCFCHWLCSARMVVEDIISLVSLQLCAMILRKSKSMLFVSLFNVFILFSFLLHTTATPHEGKEMARWYIRSSFGDGNNAKIPS